MTGLSLACWRCWFLIVKALRAASIDSATNTRTSAIYVKCFGVAKLYGTACWHHRSSWLYGLRFPS
jgi:hypothetical protein